MHNAWQWSGKEPEFYSMPWWLRAKYDSGLIRHDKGTKRLILACGTVTARAVATDWIVRRAGDSLEVLSHEDFVKQRGINPRMRFPSPFEEFRNKRSKNRRLLVQEEAVLDATELVCKIMEETHTSREDLAKRLGMTVRQLNTVLDGGRGLTVRKLSDMLHVMGGRKVTFHISPQKPKKIEEDKPKCATCGSTHKVEYSPSAGSLTFGPFSGSSYFGTPPHITMVFRCAKCEKKLARSITKTVKGIAAAPCVIGPPT